MKRFRRLTKEELDAVRPEFVRYLASEGIAADDWAKKQVHHPEQVDACLDAFSERFWEGATAAIKYVEHSPSEEDVWVFQFDETSAKLIRCVRAEGTVTWSQGGKRFEQEARGHEIFQLLEQGARPCDPERFNAFQTEMASTTEPGN
ncbi:MAG: hypothetical protein ISQ97_00495 [Flavobacteriales bacterium]|nr:hypothetical protein [Flavobacteriales bacterium]